MSYEIDAIEADLATGGTASLSVKAGHRALALLRSERGRADAAEAERDQLRRALVTDVTHSAMASIVAERDRLRQQLDAAEARINDALALAANETVMDSAIWLIEKIRAALVGARSTENSMTATVNGRGAWELCVCPHVYDEHDEAGGRCFDDECDCRQFAPRRVAKKDQR